MHWKNCLILAFTIQIQFKHVWKFFLSQGFWGNSPVSQALGSHFKMLITQPRSKKIKKALEHTSNGTRRSCLGKKTNYKKSCETVPLSQDPYPTDLNLQSCILFPAAISRKPCSQCEAGRASLLRGAGGVQQEKPHALPLPSLRCRHQRSQVPYLRSRFIISWKVGTVGKSWQSIKNTTNIFLSI